MQLWRLDEEHGLVVRAVRVRRPPLALPAPIAFNVDLLIVLGNVFLREIPGRPEDRTDRERRRWCGYGAVRSARGEGSLKIFRRYVPK